jgi:hypothetical protein
MTGPNARPDILMALFLLPPPIFEWRRFLRKTDESRTSDIKPPPEEHHPRGLFCGVFFFGVRVFYFPCATSEKKLASKGGVLPGFWGDFFAVGRSLPGFLF